MQGTAADGGLVLLFPSTATDRRRLPLWIHRVLARPSPPASTTTLVSRVALSPHAPEIRAGEGRASAGLDACRTTRQGPVQGEERLIGNLWLVAGCGIPMSPR